MKSFIYYLDKNLLKFKGEKIEIPEKINSKQTLFEFYNEKFIFPDYFGYNWDAFNDVMCCLEIDTPTLIIHKDLPFEGSPENQKIYLDLLNYFLEFWPAYNVNINFAFPVNQKEKIEGFLKEIENDHKSL